MKKESNYLFAPINKENKETLNGIASDSLTPGVNHVNSKVFNTTSLWRIQKLGKSSLQKRHFF